ncbi:MAG TPA: 2-hydroxyacyl-CoA dehydratase family protein [Syntrophorhabdaceae bacterium]|nr:2-hydroxyacyl-CoA dehydratase family protein [Syntrophorhabdaceae bacterium]HOL06263.1 2-hydroxyacyl-CoA dehydratase family protein [Syntrophorhabdaceae bacterium]HON86285.1 2-hydroxyacyl-CoA dehydratase family protein [Syntrophorhabdaceae bacterium]HOT42810.1 2-hydroxyacyl-CoA dehydratase family protein [Syntrophorhabdaceae bacterium]HPP42773.1 2-hydroxyacyl-CoA dehydratase family protein [Syntrophorhabdaceae bacterium]
MSETPKTDKPKKELTKAQMLSKKITEDYMSEAFRAHELGKLIGYTTAISPVEIFVAHDIVPIYPENHAVANLTAKKGIQLCSVTENLGYTSHLCAYARSDLGYRETGITVTKGIPEPDLFLACNAQCFTLTKWFQVLARKGNLPVFVFDTPEYIMNKKAREEIIKYCVLQLKELISFLEEITKKKFDYDRLKEVMKYSAESSILYKRFLDMAQYKPSPISIFDALIGMAIAVYRRGTPECVEYYKTLCDEFQEKADKGIGVLPKDKEKYRLYWENLPVWFKFSDHAKLLGSYGGVILTSLYVHAWSFEFDLNKDPLLTLAENYVSRFSNSTLEDRADMAMDLFKRYSMNGMIMFMNRSCKAVSFAVPTLKDVLVKRTGIPALVFESDMGDQRFYSETQIRTRIEAYFETLDRLQPQVS